MARGWESKAVEAQIEISEREPVNASRGKLSPEQVGLHRRREGLRLSRSHVLQDMERARSPRHRAILEELLRHLERELAELDAPPVRLP
jgi:hypothetical protein